MVNYPENCTHQGGRRKVMQNGGPGFLEGFRLKVRDNRGPSLGPAPPPPSCPEPLAGTPSEKPPSGQRPTTSAVCWPTYTNLKPKLIYTKMLTQ